ncbi:AraC family transcriptional regulator [Croceicoccus sediminis]|uniref:AraC-like transcriptional regulator QhpR n=1 Tax=Croceicoccus sediminis TaxID=2571150 RepID=UPI001181E938|nr:AraC family transcriptional regulator [Croceicoccus sediminis]
MSGATVSGSALRGWRSYLIEAGHESAAIACAQPDPDEVGAARSRIPLREFVSFSENIVRETRDVSIPWMVGTRYDLGSLEDVGTAIRACSTVGSAIKRMVAFYELLQDYTDIRMECDGEYASVSYRILDPDIWPRHQDAMFSLGIVAQILRKGSEEAWDHTEFWFETPSSELVAPMSRAIDAPCHFEADTNTMRFPVRFLDQAISFPQASAPIDRLNASLVRKNRDTPLCERLARVVLRDLDRMAIDQQKIAREIGMSSRTMRRKLASDGLSFQQILDECRMRQAVFEFRTKPTLPIAEIALRLGYSEHSTFTRAFHRWFDESPQAFRNRLATRVN